MNTEHRTFNIERRIWMTLRFIYLKFNELPNFRALVNVIQFFH